MKIEMIKRKRKRKASKEEIDEEYELAIEITEGWKGRNQLKRK